MAHSALCYEWQRQSHHEPWTIDGSDNNAKAMTASEAQWSSRWWSVRWSVPLIAWFYSPHHFNGGNKEKERNPEMSCVVKQGDHRAYCWTCKTHKRIEEESYERSNCRISWQGGRGEAGRWKDLKVMWSCWEMPRYWFSKFSQDLYHPDRKTCRRKGWKEGVILRSCGKPQLWHNRSGSQWLHYWVENG